MLLGHSYGGLYTQMYAARYSDEVAGVALVDSSHPGNSRALQKGGRCTNRPGVRAGSKIPSPRLGCVRCESALLAGGLPLLRALLMAAAEVQLAREGC